MKYTTVKDLAGKGAKAAGGDNVISQIRGLVEAFRQGLELVKELKALPGQTTENSNPKEPSPGAAGPDTAAKKALPPAPGPILNEFLAKYGDMTVGNALETIKPLTIKQLLELVQHGITARK